MIRKFCFLDKAKMSRMCAKVKSKHLLHKKEIMTPVQKVSVRDCVLHAGSVIMWLLS